MDSQAVFYGTPLDQPDASAYVHAIDLDPKKTTRLAPGSLTADLLGTNPSLASGASVLFRLAAGDATRIDGSPGMQTLLTLNSQAFGMDVARDGTLFISHQDRTGEVLRHSRSGVARDIVAVQPTGAINPIALALPDGGRLMLAGAGKEPKAFVETQAATARPASSRLVPAREKSVK